MSNEKFDVHLVSGGAGFLGSNLIKKLLIDENKVICVDNFITGSSRNIKEFLNHPNFKFINISVLDDLDLKVNFIWHFASPASPKFYYKNPVETSRIIYLGTLKLLELAKRNNAEFLYASSSEIYGNNSIMPLEESNLVSINTLSRRSCYSESKRLAESLCFDFQRIYGLNIKIARIFNTYGQNMSENDGRVINTFIVNALQNKPLLVNGNGKQTRSFCYVDDIVKGLISLMNSSNNEIFNLGFPEETTILNLAKIILTKIDSYSKIICINTDQDEPIRRLPSISKAEKILFWKPKISLDDGLNKTIKYFFELNKQAIKTLNN